MSNWSDEKLDAMRQVADPVADAVIAEIFASGSEQSVSRIFMQLTRDDQQVPEALDPRIRSYFETTASLPEYADPELIQAGEAMFGIHGMSCITGLFFSSLPQAYCAHRGAMVLAETGQMVNDFTRRLLETAQFVMNVMAPGGLSPTGKGIRTAQKVRLIHAAIRHLCLTKRKWPSERLGLPINQEDLAGTLITFSLVILDALKTLQLEVSHEHEVGYFHAWRCIGPLLGIRADMIPSDLNDARALYWTIRRRQAGPSPQGKLLTQALIQATQSYIPGKLFDGIPAVYIRHLIGDELADMLDVPPPNWTRVATVAQGLVNRVLLSHESAEHPLLAMITGPLNRAIMQALSYGFRHGKPVHFDIPDELRGVWQLPQTQEFEAA